LTPINCRQEPDYIATLTEALKQGLSYLALVADSNAVNLKPDIEILKETFTANKNALAILKALEEPGLNLKFNYLLIE
jgi:hypothetical protein